MADADRAALSPRMGLQAFIAAARRGPRFLGLIFLGDSQSKKINKKEKNLLPTVIPSTVCSAESSVISQREQQRHPSFCFLPSYHPHHLHHLHHHFAPPPPPLDTSPPIRSSCSVDAAGYNPVPQDNPPPYGHPRTLAPLQCRKNDFAAFLTRIRTITTALALAVLRRLVIFCV